MLFSYITVISVTDTANSFLTYTIRSFTFLSYPYLLLYIVQQQEHLFSQTKNTLKIKSKEF